MGIKLVIVDDAPFIREMLLQIFAASEIDVVGEAEDGESAILLVEELRPDVVLMDMVMPKLSGVEATEEILKRFPNTKVIGCSTVDHATMVSRALESGCCDYVVKPFKAQDLLETVRAAFKNIRKNANVQNAYQIEKEGK